jgi:hypothetical protein
VKCVEPAIRSELLDEQLTDLLLSFSPKSAVCSAMTSMITEAEAAENGKNASVCSDLEDKIEALNRKQKILLDGYLDQDIDRQTFVNKKAEIMGEKKSLEESLANLRQGVNVWVEPMRKWLNTASSICKVASGGDLLAKKSLALEIFGLNLFLHNQTIVAFSDLKNQFPELKTAFRPLSESRFCLWQNLKTTNAKIARMGDCSDFSPWLVPLFEMARTHFTTNPD